MDVECGTCGMILDPLGYMKSRNNQFIWWSCPNCRDSWLTTQTALDQFINKLPEPERFVNLNA